MAARHKRKHDPQNDSGSKASPKVAKTVPIVPASQVNLIEAEGKSCTHEVAWPPGAAGSCSSRPPPRKEGESARQYSFALDPFQQTAVNCLEAGQSVLVAAHTSAGKTAVAEYAFAMGLRDKQRVIYTSPLKALSNQKYREFYEDFRDVGLMTGDVTINPHASCLVMTTEILRSMLMRGSDVIREAAWIIFDEVHYLRDKERGVVWEQSIILTPKTARFVFLSATIPNAREFAQWIALIHGSPCHVVYTDFRPTPLQHYIFPSGADGMHMVVDERGVFRDDNFTKAVAAVEEGGSGGGAANGSRNKRAEGQTREEREQGSDIFKIVKMIMERGYDPVIVFSFSKKECEALALQMATLDLNTDDEKGIVDSVFTSALECLGERDRKLPQIQHLMPMLKRGIGVHHSGLLPILKEVVEILFQEGLIKALIATETFSTGLNMPAKTVVFTHARKFDGGGFRWITPGEYIQMSGRAGRRGIDAKGIVILMLDAKMEPPIARHMVQGAADPLHSEFHLTYSMLLALARSETDVDASTLLQRSFRQFQAQRALPEMENKISQLKAQQDAFEIEEEASLQHLQLLLQSAIELRAQMRVHLTSPIHALPFLQIGRLVRVLNTPDSSPGLPGTLGWQQTQDDSAAGGTQAESSASTVQLHDDAPWAAVVNFQRRPDRNGKMADTEGYVVEVLINCREGTTPGKGPRRRPHFISAAEDGVPLVTTISLADIAAFSAYRIHLPSDLRPSAKRSSGIQAVAEVERRSKQVLLLDPEKDMRIDSSSFRKLQRKLESKEEDIDSHPLAHAKDLSQRMSQLVTKQAMTARIKALQREVKAAQGTVLGSELKCRMRVLQRLGYIDEGGTVSLKGQVAAEIQSADELVLCEMVFKGALQGLPADAITALLSCLVWSEKSDGAGLISRDLMQHRETLLEAARRVAQVCEDAGLPMDPEEYAQAFRPELMEAMAAWCQGTHFAEVLKIADRFFEGAIVRAVRRVEELLRQLVSGARVIGNTEMAQQFEACSEKIKRDIIFAASLYL
ncbi:hypothetical protein WJX73_001880 [Symbiochloris irregularis]|uniref:Antiviral helicase n=1 Tax=Symbiochloris irregularis TaxID=706552 RepID=A0AAW1NYE8_9CHLO